MRSYLHIIAILCTSISLFAQVNTSESLRIELNKAIELSRSAKYDSAELILETLMPSMLLLHNDTLEAKAYLTWYDIKRHNEQYDSALLYMDQSIALFSSLRDSVFLGYCFRERSIRHLILGNYDKAINDSQNAIDLYKVMSDTANWARSLSGLSNINHDIEEYELGISYGEQALELLLSASLRLPDDIAYAFNCIAINYDDKGQSDQAIAYHMKVIDMKNEVSDTGLARAYNNIGNSLMKLKRYDEAISWLNQNLILNKKLGRKYGLATVKTNLGTLSYLNQEYLNAEQYLNEAEAISYEINDVEKIHDVLFQQYKLNQSWGKYEKSLAYLEKYHFFKDSLLNETRVSQMAELQTKYETEKKEQQIALQQASLATQEATIWLDRVLIVGLFVIIVSLIVIGIMIKKRMILKRSKLLQEEKTKAKEAQIKAAITSQEKERSRYAKDLHDGFGQMISILNLNLKSLENNPESRHAVFEESAKVLDDMYQELKGICFNLMPQTLINNGISPAINEFASRINISGKIIVATDYFGLEQRLEELQEISLYRITQEWVNNILKYSDASKVNIQITKDEEELTLLIEDNGSGFDGKEMVAGKGNGWKNMNSRANLIQGELELDTRVGIKGNTLIVNAPAVLNSQVKEVLV